MVKFFVAFNRDQRMHLITSSPAVCKTLKKRRSAIFKQFGPLLHINIYRFKKFYRKAGLAELDHDALKQIITNK